MLTLAQFFKKRRRTPEEKREIRRLWRENMTPEQKEEQKRKDYARHERWRKNLSPEQREHWRARFAVYRQRARDKARVRRELIPAINSASDSLNKTNPQ